MSARDEDLWHGRTSPIRKILAKSCAKLSNKNQFVGRTGWDMAAIGLRLEKMHPWSHLGLCRQAESGVPHGFWPF
jgi:hypothetical protein